MCPEQLTFALFVDRKQNHILIGNTRQACHTRKYINPNALGLYAKIGRTKPKH